MSLYRVQFEIGSEVIPDVMVRGALPRIGDEIAIDDQGFLVCSVYHSLARVDKENAVTRELIVRVR